MTSAGHISDIESAKIWAVREEERTNAWREHQREWNASVDRRMTNFERQITASNLRIEKIEKRLILLCALAAGGGGTIGTLLIQALQSFGG